MMLILKPDAQVALTMDNGSVVSHVNEIPDYPIVHKETVDADRVFEIDTCQYTLLVMIHDGYISAWQDDQVEVLSTGSMLVLPPGSICQIKESVGKTHLTFVWLSDSKPK